MPQISKATAYNWDRLESDITNKLTTRANKTLSAKRVIASSYLNNDKANKLLEGLLPTISPVRDIIYALCKDLLQNKRLWESPHVQAFFARQASCRAVNIQIPAGLWETDDDVLGFVYQSLVQEGERNMSGLYYTNRLVVDDILANKVLRDNETFLDPCCGSGAFLLGVNTNTPECIYGLDYDATAVMIAGTNLLVKYASHQFTPNVYCADFLRKSLFASDESTKLPLSFDNIYTNPPWGADKQEIYTQGFPMVTSKERASMVIVESLGRLKKTGRMGVLLPTSLLKIKAHQDIRRYILLNTTIQQIDLYATRFDGVYTDYFSIRLLPQKTHTQTYRVNNGTETGTIILNARECREGHIATGLMTDVDNAIIAKMEARRHDTLSHSKWALGIVTGNNKGTISYKRLTNMEAIYTGKQVDSFLLRDSTQYLVFSPTKFQQCAKEEYYRAPEKLIYRFISKYPVVAYDDSQRLCLNSANILIPEVDGVSIKSVAALLNSSLYRYYYQCKFPDIKVLKGNLMQLPFPQLSVLQNCALSSLVDKIRKEGYSTHYQEQLDSMVCAIFRLTPNEQTYIQTKIC